MTTESARRSKVWIVLPAFNEEGGIGELLARIASAMNDAHLEYKVIVVDDGSTDSTMSIVEGFADEIPLHLLSHPTNLGLGSSIRDGLANAARNADPRDILVTLDADNTHTPELILRMVRMVREGHDVVIASRFRPGSRVRGVSAMRRFLSLGASLLLRLLFPIKGVRDYTCGYRAYRAEVLQQLIADEGDAFFRQDGFQVMVDILLRLRRNRDLIFGEAPLILRYDMKDGSSKMDVGQTSVDTLRLILARRFGR